MGRFKVGIVVTLAVFCVFTHASTSTTGVFLKGHKVNVGRYSGALGIVTPVGRCGGLGTPIQLRIFGCDGVCTLLPGTRYDCEQDFIPAAAAPQLGLRIEVCLSSGYCTQIVEVEWQNSAVLPGFVYTAKYGIVPNDILSGQMIQFKASIYHVDNQMLESCVTADVNIV